jgi:NAD(P)-dependent dehydrogenase (short-subunit alcohol dehydrogenase family)
VTGANRGLGLETCRQLAKRGFRVLLTSRTDAEGRAAARSLSAGGLSVDYHCLDVTQARSLAKLATELRRDAVRLDVLVNNAAVSLDGFNPTVVTRTLDANFFGAMRVTDELLALCAQNANIVMVSSGLGELSCLSHELQAKFSDPLLTREELVALVRSFVREVERGQHAQAGWPSSAYRVSKVGLNAFARLLARELGESGMRVNAVCPGWVRTDMGGPGAARSVEQGAASIVWAATREDGPTGGFFRDGKAIPF